MNPIAKNIKHVVVLMLENRSFDHMLGAIPGCDGCKEDSEAATAGRVNYVMQDGQPTPYLQKGVENWVSPSGLDPLHEFSNVQRQLGYPQVTMGGFVEDAYLSAWPKVGSSDPERLKPALQSVMAYFKDGDLPALHKLAKLGAIADRWFSSVPGPTWPNRFFAMMGSCHGYLKMPEDGENAPQLAWVVLRSIAAQLGKECIFSVLPQDSSKVYSDFSFPLSSLMRGASIRPASMARFESDVVNGKLPAFSWIEPNYSSDKTKANSQHPPEDVLRGDALIARVYNTLRGKDSVWNESLLVVMYDEHGGFYDHVEPPNDAVAPDGEGAKDVAFDFRQYGVRVPVVLISPWIKAGVIKSNGNRPQYDHTSLLAFVCDWLGVDRNPLGLRVAQADHFGQADIWAAQLRTDWPSPLEPSGRPGMLNAPDAVSGALEKASKQLVAGLHALSQHSHVGLKSENLMIDKADAPDLNKEIVAKAWLGGADRSDEELAGFMEEIKKTFN